MAIFIYPRKTNYYETDRMGVIHHSNYIRYFEEARTALMEQSGFSYEEMEQGGVISPVLEIQCEYRSPVRFGDTVNIAVAVTAYNGFRLRCAYRVTDAASGELRTTGTSAHCFLNAEGRPIRLTKLMPRAHELFRDYAAECQALGAGGKETQHGKVHEISDGKL